MSNETHRKNIARAREKIVSLREQINRVKEDKKDGVESFNDRIRSTKSSSMKENYRRQRIRHKERCDSKIEHLKDQIDDLKKDIAQEQKIIARIK